jgi:response regulator RpfG family c-di-GMP phosphodiesterase
MVAFLPTRDLAGIALAHHERYDGNGYPNGLQGARIPIEARILAVADSLDAILSKNTGRNTHSYSAAWTEITRQAGRQFDPSIVETLARRGAIVRGQPLL